MTRFTKFFQDRAREARALRLDYYWRNPAFGIILTLVLLAFAPSVQACSGTNNSGGNYFCTNPAYSCSLNRFDDSSTCGGGYDSLKCYGRGNYISPPDAYDNTSFQVIAWSSTTCDGSIIGTPAYFVGQMTQPPTPTPTPTPNPPANYCVGDFVTFSPAGLACEGGPVVSIVSPSVWGAQLKYEGSCVMDGNSIWVAQCEEAGNTSSAYTPAPTGTPYAESVILVGMTLQPVTIPTISVIQTLEINMTEIRDVINASPVGDFTSPILDTIDQYAVALAISLKSIFSVPNTPVQIIIDTFQSVIQAIDSLTETLSDWANIILLVMSHAMNSVSDGMKLVLVYAMITDLVVLLLRGET